MATLKDHDKGQKAIWKRAAKSPQFKPVTNYKVWLTIEPVDEDGEKAGEDIDLPFACSGMFKTEGAALDLARLMHGQGQALAPYVEAKHREDEITDIEKHHDFRSQTEQLRK